MVDLACIFTTGGIILFMKAFAQLKYDVVDNLITRNLIVDQACEKSYFLDPYRVQWLRSNEYKLVFMIAYQDFIQLQYPDQLVKFMQQTFLEKIMPNIVVERQIYKQIPPFDKDFEVVVDKWKAYTEKQKQEQRTRTFYETKKGKEVLNTTQQNNENAKIQAEAAKKKKKDDNKQRSREESQLQQQDDQNSEDVEETQSSTAFQSASADSPQKSQQETSESVNQEKSQLELEKQEVEKARQRLFLQKKQNSLGGDSKKQQQAKLESQSSPGKDSKKKEKVMAVGQAGKITSQIMNKLDKSEDKNKVQNDQQNIEEQKKQYLGGEGEQIQGFYSDNDQSSSDEEEEQKEGANKKRNFFSKIANSIKTFTGNKILDESDITPVLEKFKEQLMTKNVAEEISQKICASIKQNMLNTKSKAFTSLSKVIKESLQSVLTKILTPKKNIDIIADAMRSKERNKPYVIVFIGVNGVGKSTNLAKVAYLFKSQGFSLMLAACDNFRAGAVEQLKTHGRCLDVPVFDKGYKEDAADIAYQAIREATLKKIDIVLIDTAGRMQDNEPLMRSLSRLVALNSPDLILFIGEALVGNDAIDQLTKFNKALIDLSPKENIREIDAIILSKFDTVDDKVGAAITMTYTTGKPILFVGVGQKYIHLKKLNIKTIVHALMV